MKLPPASHNSTDEFSFYDLRQGRPGRTKRITTHMSKRGEWRHKYQAVLFEREYGLPKKKSVFQARTLTTKYQ
jgi:hypothetical protein